MSFLAIRQIPFLLWARVMQKMGVVSVAEAGKAGQKAGVAPAQGSPKGL